MSLRPPLILLSTPPREQTREHHALVVQQLVDVCAEEEGATTLEAVCLAGIVARLEPDHPLLVTVREEANETLMRDLIEGYLPECCDAVVATDEGEEDEGWDALCALDELCAAAWWLGHPITAEQLVFVTNLMSAFPEPWMPLADRAQMNLATTPPRPEDGMLGVWTQVARARVNAAEIAAEIAAERQR